MNREIDSVSQSVIVCIGPSVAGQPTQFLLERAFASQSLDWRALSVEVAEEKFGIACAGMLAMGFRGLRLFGEYESQAVTSLANGDTNSHFIGRVTSGCPADNGWQLWDNCGFAWLDCLTWNQPPPSLIWLHGDSRATRSLFVALSQVPVAPPWLWTLAPVDQAAKVLPGQIERLKTEGRLTEAETIDNTSWLQQQLMNTQGESNPPTQKHLALVTQTAAIPDSIGGQISGLHCPSLSMITSHSSALPKLLAGCPLRRIGESELAVAGEAYDLLRWTGVAVDLALLRDAYDEYCDF